MSTTIRIGYVPEHFSTPLYIARDKGYFKETGVNVELVLCPGGTGEMTSKLQDKSLDLAIALTEGLVAGISKGQDFYKIVGTFVDAPLCWALSTGKSSRHTKIESLSKTNVAISRYGSGSHIMAFVLAEQQGWTEPFDFTVLNNFKAMRDGVNDSSCDFFMWETFTTKPYHDAGEVKRIGEITPPWPAFMFAAHRDLLLQGHQREALTAVLEAIGRASKEFMEDRDASVQLVVKMLEYPEQDVRRWFETVHYAPDHRAVSREALEVTLKTLMKADVITTAPDIQTLIDDRVAKLV
ncbi:MAG: hypothetical protein EXX96DRAFT_562474 [Benjaminiella poitrasii]|nr:MAG: hypothetical protein EXX96DRAFT_562474 [Benjaminiella poitrasii]